MLGILVLCGFGLPMPEDVVLVSAGILASHGVTHFPDVVVGVCLAGVLIGDGIVFTLGRTIGPAIKKWRIFQKIMPESRDQRVQHIIHKYGDKVIFMARFMPGLRTPIFLTCGTYHIKPWKFALFDGFAALISAYRCGSMSASSSARIWKRLGSAASTSSSSASTFLHRGTWWWRSLIGAVAVVKKRAMRAETPN